MDGIDGRVFGSGDGSDDGGGMVILGMGTEMVLLVRYEDLLLAAVMETWDDYHHGDGDSNGHDSVSRNGEMKRCRGTVRI